jgi:anti-sigma regulatory factor (Ser/Thr protein kinase)
LLSRIPGGSEPLSVIVLSNTYPALEGAIASIRHDLATIAAYLGASEALVEDVRLASSEAATSVVDVYENRGGRILVRVTPLEDALAVVVSDDGNRALQPRRGTGSRLGLLVMKECADSVSVERTDSGGIEIRMRFGLDRAGQTRDPPPPASSQAMVA